MQRLAPVFGLALVVGLAARPPLAQEVEAPQDPKLDNLVHEAGYRTAELGSLGAVVERGHGPIDMVLISGFGVGASAFEGFMRRNAERYHMLAITLPGFEGTAAPPMPPAGASYGDQTWTRGAIEAVTRLIQERGLVKPVLVGHFINGTQVAARVAIDHPELARALVLLAGTPRFEPVEETPYWPKGLTLEKKIAAVDVQLAPRWFKTVTRKTWVAGNFVATDYSVDAARGRKFAELANAPPMPVLIRYLCEFHASDVKPGLARSKLPLLIVQPSFTEAVRADKARSYLSSFLVEPWKGPAEARAFTETMFVENAGILLMDDQPSDVDAAIAGFLERNANGVKEKQFVNQRRGVNLQGLATVMLGVSELARSRAFYVGTLGLRVASETTEFVFLDAGAATISLTEEITLGKPAVAGTVQVVFAVDDVRAAHRALSERGVTFVHGPRSVDGREWAAAFRDPDGHLLGLLGPESKAEQSTSRDK